MAKVTFVIGATAAGKTHFINETFDRSQVDCLNVYDYQQRVYAERGYENHIPFGDLFRCLMRANILLLEDILSRLASDREVVVEQTFYKAKRRIAYIDEIRCRFPETCITVYVMCPSDALWLSNLKNRDMERDFQQVRADRDGIEFPNVSEGFNAIYQVLDGRAELRMDPPQPNLPIQARVELAEEAGRIREEDEARQKRQSLLDSMKERRFWHYCEVCGKKEFITAKEAFESGWDYPPDIGYFGLLGPRTCGKCLLKDTLYWKIQTSGRIPIVCDGDLTPDELVAWNRIKGEPGSLLYEEA